MESARILVVDDEPGIREGCRRVLTAEGYAVTTAADGIDGLACLEHDGAFDAAIVDLKMPRMDGLEFIKRAKARDRELVVFVITAYGSIGTAVETTKSGAYSYICKPFTPTDLLLTVTNGLEKRKLALEAERLRQEREHRLLEVAYERSKSNTIIRCLTDGVIVVNCQRQIVLRNNAAGHMLPACADLVLPASLDRLGECEGLAVLMTTILNNHNQTVIESRELTWGASTYLANASQVKERSGEILGAVAVLRDITMLKKLETAKSMFVSMVAHELKNPLAVVEGYADLLLSEGAPGSEAKQREMLQRILIRSHNLRMMITELMSLTAMESGNFSCKRVPLDLRPLITEVLAAQTEAATAAGISCYWEPDQAPSAAVLADPEAVRRMLENLITNAFKYTLAPGQVTVTTGVHNQYLKVAVTDTGIGIAPEHREKIFDEFYRVKSEQTAKVAGTGLGLHLVKKMVEIHQGRITLESRPGQGSTFTLWLPLAGNGAGGL